MAKLLGFSRFKSKKGNDCCIIFVSIPFNDYKLQHGCVGSKVCGGIFMPSSQANLLTASDIGKELTFEYDVTGEKPYLVNVTIEK